MATTDIAGEVTRLEAERDQIDLRWRRLRHASVQTPQERRELDLELAGLEIGYRETDVALAQIHAESIERRIAGIEGVDPDALSKAEGDYLAVKAVYDQLRHLEQAAHVRRRDAAQDLRQAQRTLVEAEGALEHRRQRHEELESRPIRGPLPAALWVGDHRR
jgi:chromosome segregation ATPase